MMKTCAVACALILGLMGALSAFGACTEARSAVEADLLRNVFEPPVVSAHTVDVETFNLRLQAARRSDEAWAGSVMQIALEYAGPLEGSVAAIVERNQPTESPTRSTVTIIRDGLLDDSVRAIWDEIHFFRTGDGWWEMESASRAYRCRRGPQQQHYSSELCP